MTALLAAVDALTWLASLLPEPAQPQAARPVVSTAPPAPDRRTARIPVGRHLG
jgi:hypothetical protein